MVSPRDLKWQPGDRIHFGSLDFHVGTWPQACDTIPRLFLVTNRDVTVELAK